MDPAHTHAVAEAAQSGWSWAAINPSVVVSFFGVLASLAVALLVSGRTRRMQEWQHIESLITKVIELAMQYPYMEDDSSCSRWPEMDRTTERAQRYEVYCCLVFNLIQRLCEFHRYCDKSVIRHFDVPEMARRHLGWWISDSENRTDGYPGKFDKFIRRMAKRGG